MLLALLVAFKCFAYLLDCMKSLEYTPERDRDFLDPSQAAFEVSVIQRLSARGLPDIRHTKFPPIRDVLDIGTGRGYFVDACRKAGLNAYGVDARNDVYTGDKSRFVLADARQLPFGNESFDLVYETLFFDDLLVLQKISYEEFAVIVHEVHRVMRPRGILYMYGGARPYIDMEMFEPLSVAHTKQFYKKRAPGSLSSTAFDIEYPQDLDSVIELLSELAGAKNE